MENVALPCTDLTTPGRTFSPEELFLVWEELKVTMSLFRLELYIDVLNLLEHLLEWLDQCGVRMVTLVDESCSCKRCKSDNRRISKQTDFRSIQAVHSHLLQGVYNEQGALLHIFVQKRCHHQRRFEISVINSDRPAHIHRDGMFYLYDIS